MSLSVLADRVELPRPTVFRLLATLEQAGLVERISNGSYRLGLTIVSIARLALARGLLETSKSFAEELFQSFGHTVNIGVLDKGEVLIVDVIESRHNPRVVSPVGTREPVHATALGKAIAAHIDSEALVDVLRDHPLHAITPATITSRTAFERELGRVRKQGFATDEGECRVDGNCVAVPIIDRRGIAGAMSLSATSSQLPAADFPLVAPSLITAAREIANALGSPS